MECQNRHCPAHTIRSEHNPALGIVPECALDRQIPMAARDESPSTSPAERRVDTVLGEAVIRTHLATARSTSSTLMERALSNGVVVTRPSSAPVTSSRKTMSLGDPPWLSARPDRNHHRAPRT